MRMFSGALLAALAWVAACPVYAVQPTVALSQSRDGRASNDAAIPESIASPLAFEKNEGQFDAAAKFFVRTSAYQVFLTQNEAVMVFEAAWRGAAVKPGAPQSDREASRDANQVVRIQFENSSSRSRISGESQLYRSNYFVDRKHRAGVPNYATVRYRSIYSGVDLVYHGERGQFEYDLLVAPKADPSQIQLRISGADVISASGQGDLVLGTKIGDITFRRPIAYQDIGGKRIPVEARYALDGNRLGFRLGAYDVTQPVTIDPILSYSTLFGWGTAQKIVADSNGNAYVVGYTTTKTLPASTGYQTSLAGTQDAWVAKIDPTGRNVVWATYLGARRATSSATGIAVDSSGNVYVSGLTNSTAFPHTSGAYQATFSGTSSGFVTKLNSSGSALVYSTFVPFTAGVIAVDASNQLHLFGNPGTTFTPTANAFQRNSTVLGLLKLNVAGSAAVYSTYLGNGTIGGMAIDGSGNACVAGATSDRLFPAVNAIQSSPKGANDAFVSKINPTGTALVYSTFLGGTADDYVNDLGIDGAGNAVIAGWTTSSDFPTTPGVFQPVKGYFPAGGVRGLYVGATISNGFVAKISNTGSNLIFATYLGGSFCASTGCSNTLFTCSVGVPGCPPNTDRINAVAVDAAGFVSVGGYTTSRDFPIADPIQGLGPANDDDTLIQPFLSRLTPNGDRLVYSTAFGTRGQYQQTQSIVQSVAVDPTGAAYAIGNYAGANQFPVSPGAPFASNYSQFLLKVSAGKYPTQVSSSTNPATAVQTIQFIANVLSTKTGGTVSFMDGSTVIGTSAVSNGRAVFATTLAAGAHKITAVYSGDSITSPPIYQIVTNP